MILSHRSLFVASVFGALGVAAACSSPLLVTYCTNIPAGGCPGADGTNCVDPTCAAIYERQSDCSWTFVQDCPGYVAPADAAVAHGDGSSSADGGPTITDAAFPLPEGAAGGPGCTELETPDCPLALAAGCGASCCGCQNLFVCSDGGWNAWGVCGDAGPSPTP